MHWQCRNHSFLYASYTVPAHRDHSGKASCTYGDHTADPGERRGGREKEGGREGGEGKCMSYKENSSVSEYMYMLGIRHEDTSILSCPIRYSTETHIGTDLTTRVFTCRDFFSTWHIML